MVDLIPVDVVGWGERTARVRPVRGKVFPASRRFQTVPSRIAAARLALMPGGRQRRAPPTAGGG